MSTVLQAKSTGIENGGNNNFKKQNTMNTQTKKIKVGIGFWQSGYGKGLNKTASIYLIDSKLYAKCMRTAKCAFDGDKLNEGFVCVNKINENTYCQCSISEHQLYNK